MNHSTYLREMASEYRTRASLHSNTTKIEQALTNAAILEDVADMLDEQEKGPRLVTESEPVRIPVFDVATGKTY